MSKDKEKKVPVPHHTRLPHNSPGYKEIIEAHKKAFLNGDETYIDPETGFTVFTALYHLERGFCCNSFCRHCPFIFDPPPKK